MRWTAGELSNKSYQKTQVMEDGWDESDSGNSEYARRMLGKFNHRINETYNNVSAIIKRDLTEDERNPKGFSR
ncbi:hypothetical protein [Actinomadura algeriensis]|uniref:WXG100 family type VII secretion target n=1 Tax=Actinomadura algeriensis TaxID=1679523 RepID=A0ABR9JSI7_9ACTN|nr:hypothetical protein [Actinomadura algeriensis]MBE1533343.1 hypothetical protein [Actinomadura algeriensis]